MKRKFPVCILPLCPTALPKKEPLLLMTTLFGLNILLSRVTAVLAGVLVPITTTVACGCPRDVVNLLSALVGMKPFLALRLPTSPLACEQRWPNNVIAPLRRVRPCVRPEFTAVSLTILTPVAVLVTRSVPCPTALLLLCVL